MPFVWLSDPTFVAPYRSDDIQESCELALDYFSGLVDQFISKLPEHRLQQDFHDWMADEHSLPEKIHLIFPNGYGDYDEDRNQNPNMWPGLIELADTVRNGTTVEFANELCELCEESFNEDGQCDTQMKLLQRIFDNFTYFLQMFVTYADAESIRPDFVPVKDFDLWWTEANQRMVRRYYG